MGAFLGVHEIYLLFGAGLAALLLHKLTTKNEPTLNSILALPFLQLTGTTLLTATNTQLFWIFLKIGSILYGSGYVLFAFLDTELVATGLLSRQQLIDAIAVGQFTPGPVFSSVTFIGYQINGVSGAIVSTIGIFLPSFVLVGLLSSLVKKMRNSKTFAVFLDAVNVASVALIISICFVMGKDTITDWRTIAIALLSIFITFRYNKINSAFIVLGGALLGYLFYHI